MTNCHQLKMQAEDGKLQLTDTATAETILRLVHPEEKRVEYITTAERIGIEKGIQQGIQQGEQLGIEKARFQAAQEERKFLTKLLNQIMGDITQDTLQKIESSTNEELKAWITKKLSEEPIASR
ncbi:MAG: hypothetical protein JSR17_01685 [Proteobacteria bacterium]|nr:hypothetical protein [Pseudomonadota bacterium]